MKGLSLLAIIACLMFTAQAAPAAPGALNLSGLVEVGGERVTLLDLVRDNQNVEPELARRLSAVKIMSSPKLGREARITGTRLRALLIRAGLPSDITVLIPATIKIRRVSQTVEPGELVAAYEEQVHQRLADRGLEGEISRVRAGRVPVLPSGDVSLKVRLKGGRLEGRVPATVEVSINGRMEARVRISGTVEIYGMAVVAARPLTKGHVIQPEDLRLEKMRLSGLKGQAATDMAHVEGLRTRMVVSMGEVLLLGRLERAPLIKRGDIVTMVCKAKGLRITTKGKAQKTGYKGSSIPLFNLASKRKVYGKVLDSGTVQVGF